MVGAPLLLAGSQHAFADAGPKVKHPFIGFRVPRNYKFNAQLTAVALNDFNGIHNGLAKYRVLRPRQGRRILVEGHVVYILVIGQNHRIRVGYHAAFATQGNRFGAPAFGCFAVLLGLYQLQLYQSIGQIRKHAENRYNKNDVTCSHARLEF